MPQFELANFAPQFAWLVLAFAVVYFGIVRPSLAKLGGTVDERENKVSGDIRAAGDAKAESDRVHDAYEAEMRHAHEAAHRAIGDAKAEAVAEAEKKLGSAKAEIMERQERAFAALEVARAKALADIQTLAAEAAAEIVERLGGDRPDDATALTAVRGALAA